MILPSSQLAGELRIRVYFLCGTLGSGGVPSVVLDVAKHIQPRVENLTVAYLGGPDDSVRDFLDLGIEVEKLGDGFPSKGLPQSIYRSLSRNRPDIIHTHMAPPALIGRPLAKINGAAIVSTVHNVYSERSIAARLMDTPTSWLCDAVVSVSNTVDRSLPRFFGIGSRREVIHNCIDVEQVRNAGEVEWESLDWTKKVPVDSNIIANVARFSKKKGQHHLIHAMPDVLKKNPNTTLVMTGWGDRTSTLKSLSKELGVDENIIFLGRVSNPYSVYYHADVVAFPSRFEGFSISMLEAMAFAKPIVATNIGPFVEALGENHQYVDFGDAAGLSEHITRYLKNESVAVQDGERAKSRVQSLFSGSVGADKHYNLYQSLI